MKKLIPAAMLAIALAIPIGAIAGELPAPGLGPDEAQALHLTPQQQQQMGQVWTAAHAKMRQLHVAGRSQILGSLTPQQRSLVAQVIGNLAISPNPDEQAAALQIQNSLTPQQSQRIISLHSSLEQQAINIMQSAKAQADSFLTADQRQKVQQEMSVHFGAHPGMGPESMGMHGQMLKMGGENPATQAGFILLHIASHGMSSTMEYRVRITRP